jgi:hypothetical protein
MTTKITAQEARTTKIFVIENGKVIETTLFDHVCESAEETTSPRGVMHKLFIDEIEEEIYGEIGTEKLIDAKEYDSLAEEDQESYNYFGSIVKYALRKWLPNGKVQTIDVYEKSEDADDEWFDRTYKFDFQPDDQRDTSYWYTREDADAELKERLQNQ